jgi:hypothetical protein
MEISCERFTIGGGFSADVEREHLDTDMYQNLSKGAMSSISHAEAATEANYLC